MQCPKCEQEMATVMCGDVEIDRCLSCQGIWFDKGEAEALAAGWVSTYIDSGDPGKGEEMDEVDDIDCPRCGSRMRRFFDIEGCQIQFEECDTHGRFFDAGEFTLWAANQYL
jgi:Zn-finger nucleic acid-binding protein